MLVRVLTRSLRVNRTLLSSSIYKTSTQSRHSVEGEKKKGRFYFPFDFRKWKPKAAAKGGDHANAAEEHEEEEGAEEEE